MFLNWDTELPTHTLCKVDGKPKLTTLTRHGREIRSLKGTYQCQRVHNVIFSLKLNRDEAL